MKTLELYIITDEKRIKYFIEEPETDEEYDKGLAGRDSLPEKHGMIYLKRDPREIMAFWTPQTKIYVDFIFVNFAGDIIKIVHNAKPLSEEMYECNNTMAVLEINGGECKKFGIKEGDSVVHPVLNLSSENQYKFHNFMFNKLTDKILNKLDLTKIAFVAAAAGGAMGWGGSCQFWGKYDNQLEKYMITWEGMPSKENIDKFFKTIHPHAWKFYDLGMGNRLCIKREYYDKFIAETERLKLENTHIVYREWCRVVYNILTENNKEKVCHWVKQKYYGIDMANLDKVLSTEWWANLEYDDFDAMMEDGKYLAIKLQNTNKSVLDLGIDNCRNKEILELLRYYKEKEQN